MSDIRDGSSSFNNTILSRLDANAIQRLRLQPMPSPRVHSHRNPLQTEHLFFLEAGFAPSVVLLDGGLQLAVGISGRQSIVGAASLLGRQIPIHSDMRSAGHAYACLLEDAQREFRRMELFHELVLESVRVQMLQAMHFSACNAVHDVQQRLSRWLLQCHDEVPEGYIYASHDDLGNALGCCRTTITAAMEVLRRDGMIYYSRARVNILDKANLEQRACECYPRIREACAVARMPLERAVSDGIASLYPTDAIPARTLVELRQPATASNGDAGKAVDGMRDRTGWPTAPPASGNAA